MKKVIDEFELSFPLNIWEKMLYENVHEFQLDIYCNDRGFPANIFDLGGSELINKYRLILIDEICEKNNTDTIWRVSSDAFAIIAKGKNCNSFEIKIRDINLKILRKTVLISLQ